MQGIKKLVMHIYFLIIQYITARAEPHEPPYTLNPSSADSFQSIVWSEDK